MKIDIVIDLQYGDCAKGKIIQYLIKTRPNFYTHCLRFNGGHNAGHTVYIEDKKIITHIVPIGTLNNIISIIGPGCVISSELLQKELREISHICPNVRNYLRIAKNTHVITKAHLLDDGDETRIGTTRRGTGPAYADKYNRTGKRAEKDPYLKKFIIDIYEEFYIKQPKAKILMEGAQGFYLDIDHGDYPYVTSSHVTVAGALTNGFPHTAIREIWGAAKVYETYVGSKVFQPKEQIFNKIAEIGQEKGATTGRTRQVNFLNLDQLIKAVRINGVKNIVLSKIDVLREVNTWKIIVQKEIKNLKTETNFIKYIRDSLFKTCPTVTEVFFSDSPLNI